MQVVFNRQGEVVHYYTDCQKCDARLTQLLWNVEGGNGHITVMVGRATQLLAILRNSGHSRRTEFTSVYYGMDSSGTQGGLESVAPEVTWEVPTFCDLLPVVVGLYNSMHDDSLALEDIRQIRCSMSTFRGQDLLQVYTALNRLTTCIKESDEGPASVARVLEALRTNANSKAGSTKGINCHALVVAAVIIYTFNYREGGQNISVLASCDHLQVAYEGRVLLLRGDPAHFVAAGQYE